MSVKNILVELMQCLEKNRPVALATVVKVSGSTPGQVAAKMLVFNDGSTRGTVGGGELEAAVIKEAKKVIKDNTARCKKYDLSNQEAGERGMICGGQISIFIEPFVEAPLLLIFGAGHVSQFVARLGKMLDFQVVVWDDREEFASAERFPEADTLVVDDLEKALDNITINKSTYVVIVTRGHRHDQVALEKVINSDVAYLGMIGSREKVDVTFENLRKKGISDSLLAKVHAPIGLKIGGHKPAEIALSIMAEILQERYQSNQSDLR